MAVEDLFALLRREVLDRLAKGSTWDLTVVLLQKFQQGRTSACSGFAQHPPSCLVNEIFFVKAGSIAT